MRTSCHSTKNIVNIMQENTYFSFLKFANTLSGTSYKNGAKWF